MATPADKVCGCVEPRERDPLIYNRTYTQRLARWRADKTGDKLMGPSVIDVQGAKRLLQKSGGRKLPLSELFWRIRGVGLGTILNLHTPSCVCALEHWTCHGPCCQFWTIVRFTPGI
jgi:hypothetical protein